MCGMQNFTRVGWILFITSRPIFIDLIYVVMKKINSLFHSTLEGFQKHKFRIYEFYVCKNIIIPKNIALHKCNYILKIIFADYTHIPLPIATVARFRWRPFKISITPFFLLLHFWNVGQVFEVSKPIRIKAQSIRYVVNVKVHTHIRAFYYYALTCAKCECTRRGVTSVAVDALVCLLDANLHVLRN